jgi:hypothetical protein
MDNLIMTLAVALYASLLGQSKDLMNMALHLSAWASAPILGIFLARLMFSKLIKFSYTWHLVFFTYAFAIILMVLMKGGFGASEQLAILIGVIGSVVFIWPYSWIMQKEKDYYEVSP